MKYFKYLLLLLFCFVTSVSADTTYKQGVIAKGVTDVYVRKCASSNCDRILSDTGSKISISYPRAFEIIGEEGNFYKIRLQYSGFWYEGFITKGNSSISFVDVKEYTISDSLITEYINKGFPESYARNLAVLKSVHPTWEFMPYNVNATFDEVVAGETRYVNLNLINGSNETLRSTEDGAYSDGKWITFEGGWYAASKQTIKFYLDPRNFLNDERVFMFEELAYKESIHTEELVQTMLRGTFMEGNTFYYNDSNEKVEVSYARTFMDSAKKNGVSPVHLVARAIQEQGTRGSVLSSGDNAEYPGYYNFFNINASGKTQTDIIRSGLAYAKKKNWNSPYAAIVDGGNLLSRYVTEYKQSTLYSQKFDLAGETYYSTQYMQNVRAPYSESFNYYEGYYDNGLIDTGFIFSIPVFKGDMPTLTTLDVNYNEDNTLASLSVTGCNLMPSFTSSATNYTCYISKDVNKVTVNATATNVNAKVEGIGEKTLDNDETKLDVVVTSASGDKKTYTVLIQKREEILYSPDEVLSNLQINIKNNYISHFDENIDASSFISQINLNYPTMIAEISENKILSTGMTLKLKGNGEKTYTIVIYGDNNGDGNIDIVDLLKVQKDILGVNKLTDGYREAADVNKDGVVDIIDLLKIQKHILGVSKIEQ